MIGEEGRWKKVTIAEARKYQDQNLIYWRPDMARASVDNPEQDPAFVLEDITEVVRKKR